jgi:tripartite-type tricarboxylate transporter receptor subunit TctC
MSIDRRTFTSSLIIGSLAAAAGGHAGAAERQVRFVCPYAAGGATDLLTRIVALRFGERTRQSTIVDNRAGGGGNVGHQYVAAAKPDGSVLLLGAIGPLSIAPHLSRLTYDPQKDLAPLTMGAVFPNVLVVPPSLGVKTVAEFVELARKKPRSLDYASTGAGSAAHLAGELFNSRAGIDVVHIPYKGGSQAMVDVLGGRVAAYYAAPPTARPYIDAGKLIALATTGPARSAQLPQVPTIAESGYPGFNALNWYAFLAPGKTPEAELESLNRDLVAVLRLPEVQQELLRNDMTPQPGSRAELARYIAEESARWGKLIRERKITAD